MKKQFIILLILPFYLLFILPKSSAQILHKNFVDVFLHVTSPVSDPYPVADGYIITAEDRIAITINFNWPVKTATVKIGETVFLDFPKQNNAAADATWSGDNKTLTLTTRQTRAELLIHNPDAYFSVRLKGSNQNTIIIQGRPPLLIESESGHILDGDNDGKDGGNCIIRFVSVG